MDDCDECGQDARCTTEDRGLSNTRSTARNKLKMRRRVETASLLDWLADGAMCGVEGQTETVL